MVEYNFDDRLLWESFDLSEDNYVDDLIKINGIYYRYQSTFPLKIGDRVIVIGVRGNVLILKKDNRRGRVNVY